MFMVTLHETSSTERDRQSYTVKESTHSFEPSKRVFRSKYCNLVRYVRDEQEAAEQIKQARIRELEQRKADRELRRQRKKAASMYAADPKGELEKAEKLAADLAEWRRGNKRKKKDPNIMDGTYTRQMHRRYLALINHGTGKQEQAKPRDCTFHVSSDQPKLKRSKTQRMKARDFDSVQ